MEDLRKWDKEILDINRKIMDLRTELFILEGRKQELYDKRSARIMELHTKVNEKERGGRND